MSGTDLPVSVIVISRNRPACLQMCIRALMLQDHGPLELVVVADRAGLAAAAGVAGAAFKGVPHDEPGVSAARNTGLHRAAAEIVAFIDDDAIAEPTWVGRLAAAFADGTADAATGPVLGPRGIGAEWSGSVIDGLSRERPLGAPAGRTSTYAARPGEAVVTIGTNCAFRRAAVMESGGFDPSYRYYLDESDLDMRLAARGAVTAFVPDAVVHHLRAANAVRRADRATGSLHEIGRSTAIFLRRHGDPARHAAALAALRERHRLRLLRQMVSGRLMPERVSGILSTLDAGFAEGLGAGLADLLPLAAAAPPFLRLGGTGPRAGTLLSGRTWSRAALRRRADTLAADGRIVTVLTLSPGFRPHRVRFHPAGWWEQRGGLFRTTESGGANLVFSGFRRRVADEAARIARTRPV